MARSAKWILATLIAVCILGAGRTDVLPVFAMEPQQQIAGISERWSVGTYVEGPPTYLATSGRFLGTSAAVRSNRGVTEMAFVFPATSGTKTMAGAGFYLLSRTGVYNGDATLSLRTYSYDGVLQRTVSAANVDLETVAIGQWYTVPLSANSDDLTIHPGEFLVFHVALSGASDNDLDARLMFDVAVR